MLSLQDLLGRPDEKPLENLVQDGGYTAIFRTIACVGDSLSSGEFESLDKEGNKGYHDFFDYSWGQYMARTLGCTVYNFSRGGMKASEYMESFAKAKGFWDKSKAAQCYILALGVNDIAAIRRKELELGTAADIADRWQDNAKTFAGYYAGIIQRYKEIQPEAKFFLMTIPVGTDAADSEPYMYFEKHARLIYDIAAHFSNTYVLDFRKYAPVYDQAFHDAFFAGHMNPMGYVLTSKLVMSYIDYIIRHNMKDFSQVGLMGTPFKY